ncbi:hypothetical protein BGZ82_010715 [Podila clonocystis]|nr:hypothetical protein BGZ82_010715 [Podila clonocystis]
MTRIETRIMTVTATVTATFTEKATTVTSTVTIKEAYTDTKKITMTVTWTREEPYAMPTPIDGFFEGPDDVARKVMVKAGPALVKPNEEGVEGSEVKAAPEDKDSPKISEEAPKVSEVKVSPKASEEALKA